MEKDKEMEDILPVSIADDPPTPVRSSEVVTAIEHECLPLMDWERGLVGWESESDPANPLYGKLPFGLFHRVNFVGIGIGPSTRKAT